MKFEDDTQNLRVRLRVVQLLILVMLVVLGVRLYMLQIVKGRYYADRAENQRIRMLPIPATRGAILDRTGKVVLVDSRSIYNVIVSREDIKGNFDALIDPLSVGLEVDPEFLRTRLKEIESQPAFESIRIKENATPSDIAWVEARALEFPQVRVEAQPQRRYKFNEMLAHVLGYVGEISPEQLEQAKFKSKGYKAGDIIGVEGIEYFYDDALRGRDGYRKVVVDSRGHIQEEIEKVDPQAGQDLVTTIDLDLQEAAEQQLRDSPSKRGVIIAIDPNNGEILALASAPTFDPNIFSQRISSKEGRAEYAALLKDPSTPLYNRAIQGRYPPGSTWKIPMAVAGLQQGVITIDHSSLVCGGGITIGNKFTRCMGNHGTPELRTAITRSCDGYFYRLGLKMKLEGIMAMVDEFEMNKRTGVDLPGELISWTPSREFKARWNPRDPEWREIDTVYASFGQVYDFVTPLALLRTIASVSIGGQLYVPHLMKEVREISAVGEPDRPDYRPARPAHGFERAKPKVIPIDPAQHHFVVEGMWGVVNNGGTAARIKMAGFDIAGKTGTAQVVELGKDTGDNKDHAWFVAFAPAYKPEISVLALIENVGFGGTHAAPAARALFDVYYRNTRHESAPPVLVARR